MNTHTTRIGADVGGTFTDVIALDDAGGVRTLKVPSTPPDFEQAVLHAIEILQRCAASRHGFRGASRHPAGAAAAPLLPPLGRVTAVAHGTTVATNAVLEHRGARTALIVTRGFRDVLELRRIRAPQMYDLFWDKPQELVERYLRFEITERMGADGTVVTPLAEAELPALKDALVREGIESIAVCFLHAYAFPNHEQIVGEFLRRELPTRCRSPLIREVLRERKEYERTSTTVVNAYVRVPSCAVISTRCKMACAASDRRAAAHHAVRRRADAGVRCGPCGLCSCSSQDRRPASSRPVTSRAACGLQNVMTLDIGGTTAKASLIEDGRIAYSPETTKSARRFHPATVWSAAAATASARLVSTSPRSAPEAAALPFWIARAACASDRAARAPCRARPATGAEGRSRPSPMPMSCSAISGPEN